MSGDFTRRGSLVSGHSAQGLWGIRRVNRKLICVEPCLPGKSPSSRSERNDPFAGLLGGCYNLPGPACDNHVLGVVSNLAIIENCYDQCNAKTSFAHQKAKEGARVSMTGSPWNARHDWQCSAAWKLLVGWGTYDILIYCTIYCNAVRRRSFVTFLKAWDRNVFWWPWLEARVDQEAQERRGRPLRFVDTFFLGNETQWGYVVRTTVLIFPCSSNVLRKSSIEMFVHDNIV